MLVFYLPELTALYARIMDLYLAGQLSEGNQKVDMLRHLDSDGGELWFQGTLGLKFKETLQYTGTGTFRLIIRGMEYSYTGVWEDGHTLSIDKLSCPSFEFQNDVVKFPGSDVPYAVDWSDNAYDNHGLVSISGYSLHLPLRPGDSPYIIRDGWRVGLSTPKHQHEKLSLPCGLTFGCASTDVRKIMVDGVEVSVWLGISAADSNLNLAIDEKGRRSRPIQVKTNLALLWLTWQSKAEKLDEALGIDFSSIVKNLMNPS